VSDSGAALVYAPVSWGELIDKITILEIKAARIRSAAPLANVRTELNLLSQIAEKVASDASIQALKAALRAINQKLWDIEDSIREKERRQEFDEPFIQLARSVYTTNDERSRLKRRINFALGSKLIEEKSYGEGELESGG
jgi:Family of unknown function (DUF6165)